jgi:CheY-like chemotaxis protein
MKKPSVPRSGSPGCGVGLTRPVASETVGFTRLRMDRAAPRMRYVTSRILIVDDSRHFRAAVTALLDARGFDVLESAADGEQALAAVACKCPDGILLDINLPGSDGFAVAARLAAACSGARIVLTSAEVDQVPAEVLRACAAIAFVPKQELAVADLSTFFSG